MTVQRVRLLGLSAPLKEQSPWGDRARQRLSDLIKEQKVTLEFDVKQKITLSACLLIFGKIIY